MNLPTQVNDTKAVGQEVLAVEGLRKSFPLRSGWLGRETGSVRAVDGLDLRIHEGETVSLVGESGCGKSTASLCVMRALDPTEGNIYFSSKERTRIDLARMSRRSLRPLRREFQMIFQDPFSSLNPRMTVFDIVNEPLLVHKIGTRSERRDRVEEILAQVGLRPELMRRYPHAFSGGQRQRIGIARALASNPRLVVADEPVSALDVSVQAQVLNLLMDLQDRYRLAYLFIAHDLGVVRHISHRVVVMYVGRVAEVGDPDDLFNHPRHPYTQMLLASMPGRDRRRRSIGRALLRGEVANPASPPSGCYFHPRCAYATALCAKETPPLREVAPGRSVSCHYADELTLEGMSA